MSKWLVAVAVLVLSLPVVGRAQLGRGGAPPAPRSIAGHGINVPGWWARTDNPVAGIGGLRLMSEGAAVRATTGPAAIFWYPRESASGQYTVKAKFTLPTMPRFEEGYGLFIGGTNLDKDNERFTAFVITEDGSYAIRQRRGVPAAGPVYINWTSSPALTRPDATRRQANELAIHVGVDDVVFMANGKEVARRKLSEVDTDGVAGLRVNTNLDVLVDGFAIEQDSAKKP